MNVYRLSSIVGVLIAPFLLLIGLMGMATAVAPQFAQAAPDAIITVNNLNDSGPGSLRQAISDANLGDTIAFSVSGTIVLSSELLITKSLTIDGGGDITVSGNNAVRVFNIMGGNVVLDRLTVIRGNVQTLDCGSDPEYWCGGGVAVQNNSVVLTVTNSVFSENSATYGGAIYVDGGAAFIHNSAFFSNSVSGEGGALYNYLGVMTVAHSVVYNNSAAGGGGGLISWEESSNNCAASPTTRIVNSTFSGNTAAGYGGAIYLLSGVAEIVHSTITANTASANDQAGGGVLSANGAINCTRIGHTIVAGNINGDVAAFEEINRYHSLGYNLLGAAGVHVDFSQDFTATGDQTNVPDPKIGPLADNGGPTLTHMPQHDSPAIDGGAAVCSVATDQRGAARPMGAACDIGAVEKGFIIFLPFVARP